MENAGWKPRIMTLCHVHTKTNKPRARFFTLQASVTILMLKLITKQLEKDWTNSFKGLPGDSLFSLKSVKQQNLGFQCLGQIKLWLSSIMCLLARFPLFVSTLNWLQQITAPSWVWFFLSKMCFFSSQCHQMLIHRLSTDFRGFLCIILRSLTYNIKRAECCCDSVLYENSWIELTYVMLCCSSHIEQPNVNFCTDLRFYLYNVYNVKIWVKCFVCLPVFVL